MTTLRALAVAFDAPAVRRHMQVVHDSLARLNGTIVVTEIFLSGPGPSRLGDVDGTFASMAYEHIPGANVYGHAFVRLLWQADRLESRRWRWLKPLLARYSIAASDDQSSRLFAMLRHLSVSLPKGRIEQCSLMLSRDLAGISASRSATRIRRFPVDRFPTNAHSPLPWTPCA
jgi:hypothetical protein